MDDEQAYLERKEGKVKRIKIVVKSDAQAQ
jgi:hypothetical protein